MAKGYDKHQERQNDLASFGRELVRRSGTACELCRATGVSLTIFEVPPLPEEPHIEHCLHLCETCQEQIKSPKLMEPNHWRCLYETIWSEVPAAQVMAVRLLRRLSDHEPWATHEPWAAELLSEAYLAEETQVWADQEA